MDANKLRQLKAVGYKIQRACFNCVNSEFPSYVWGTCKLHHYAHLKHTDEKRQLSIHITGTCIYHRLDEIEIHAYIELLEDK